MNLKNVLINCSCSFLEKVDKTMNRAKHSYKEKNTFIVKLDNRQRDTWQGEIVWADENRTERFRSALELIKLMDEAMNKSAAASDSDQEISAV
jgi:hypothetical protein